jgi:GH25 family lysozyme M1 (1,4-beta-N-acetylmuramidase)
VAPIPGDECAVCGAGMLLRPGVDVSQWQGVIDWQTLAPYIDFAIIRIGYRALDGTLNYDPQYENNVQGCEANGIPYGVYFYSIAHNELEAMEEADFVLAKIWQTGKYQSLPVFMDVEDRGVLTTLSNDQILATISTFCDYLGQFNLRTEPPRRSFPVRSCQLVDQQRGFHEDTGYRQLYETSCFVRYHG